MKTKAATKTEVTGPDATTCTGMLNTGKTHKFHVGDEVSVLCWYDAGDGGDISGRRYAKIERIARGTEYGMYGQTALVLITISQDGAAPLTAQWWPARKCEPVTWAVAL